MTPSPGACRDCPLARTLRVLHDRLQARREEIDRCLQAVRQLRDERDQLRASLARRAQRIQHLERELSNLRGVKA